VVRHYERGTDGLTCEEAEEALADRRAAMDHTRYLRHRRRHSPSPSRGIFQSRHEWELLSRGFNESHDGGGTGDDGCGHVTFHGGFPPEFDCCQHGTHANRDTETNEDAANRSKATDVWGVVIQRDGMHAAGDRGQPSAETNADTDPTLSDSDAVEGRNRSRVRVAVRADASERRHGGGNRVIHEHCTCPYIDGLHHPDDCAALRSNGG